MNNSDIQKGLDHESQRLLERVPEKADCANTREIAKAVLDLLEEHSISQAELARWAGMSGTTVSQFLSGKYDGSYARIANKLVGILNNFRRQKEATKGCKIYISTSIAGTVMELIRRVESFSGDEGMIGLVIGDGGHGKSVCLRQYAKANLKAYMWNWITR